MVGLDFSVLYEPGKKAVLCDTEEKGKQFVKEMCERHPENTKHWKSGQHKWGWYGKEQCYAPHISDGENGGQMQFCSRRYWVEHGYTIIPFDGLLVRDLGEITCSHSLEQLFEIGV